MTGSIKRAIIQRKRRKSQYPKVKEEKTNTHTIRINGETFYQDDAGNTVVEASEYLAGLPILNEMLPEMLTRHNTPDASLTCPFKTCNTSFYRSQQKELDRCPFCHRLLPLGMLKRS